MSKLTDLHQRITEALDYEMETMFEQIRAEAGRLHDPRLLEIVRTYCDRQPEAVRRKMEEILHRSEEWTPSRR